MTFEKYQLDHNIGFLVNDISRLMSTEYNKIMKPLGLTRAQWRVVVHLHRKDGLTQSQLAELLGAGKVSVGGLIDRLEHSGWVERRDDPQDRRSNRVFLTEKGRAIEKEMEKTGRELTSQTLRNLGSDERAQLVDLLIAVKNNLLEIDSGSLEEAKAAY
jgi:MarR family transcriptional regulator for hemolysin